MAALLARLLAGLQARGLWGTLRALTDPHAAIGFLGADKLANAVGAGPLVDALNPNNDLRRGLITGEGRRAGISSYYHGFKMGLNPLDLVSQRTAQNIEVGVREQGFSGHQANRAGEASVKLINDLGIDYQKAIELVTDNLRHGTESMKEFVSQMHELKDIAKETGLSMKDIVNNMSDFVQKSVEAGGRSAQRPAGHLYKTLESTLNISRLGGSNKASFEQFLFTKGKELTTLGGGNPLMANTAEGLRHVPAGLQKYVEQILAAKPANMSNADWAAMLINSGEAEQFFPGLNNDQLTLLFDHVSRKGGIAAGFQKTEIKTIRHAAKTASNRKNATAQALLRARLSGGMGGAASLAFAYSHGGIDSISHMNEIQALDTHLAQMSVGARERGVIRSYLEKSKDWRGAESRVLDNLNVILTLDPAETRRFLNTGQLTKNANLQRKNGVNTTKTSGARSR